MLRTAYLVTIKDFVLNVTVIWYLTLTIKAVSNLLKTVMNSNLRTFLNAKSVKKAIILT